MAVLTILVCSLIAALTASDPGQGALWAVALFAAPRRKGRDDPALNGFGLVADSPAAYVLTGGMGLIRAVNPAGRRLAERCGGLATEGARIRDLLASDPDADAKIYRAMRAAAESGGVRAEFLLDTPDAALLLSAELSRAPGGAGVLWRLEAAERSPEIAEEAPRPLALLDDAPVGFFSADRGGEILAVNRTLLRWIGEAEDRAPDAPPLFMTDIFPDGARKLSPALARIGERIVDAAALRTPDGGRRPVLVAQVLREAEGGAGGAATQSFVMPGDASGRLGGATSGARLVRFLDDAPVAVAVITRNGIIVEANDMLVEISGGAARVGEDIAVAVRLEDRKDVAERIRVIAAGDSPLGPLDVKLTGEAGAEHEAQFHAHRIDTDRGEMLLAYLIDVSEQKKIEHQLAMVQKMQAVGQLAGGIAHDVNNVLTAIRGHCDLLMLRRHAGDPDFDYLNQIRAQTERAAEVISQLLAFSRRQVMRREVTQLTDMLDDMSFMLKPLITERVNFTVRHVRDLGLVRIDRSEFQRVVMNLTVNAVDAMPSGGSLTVLTRNVTPEQSVEFDYPIMKKGAYVLIEVADTGAGIPKDQQQKVFEPFFTTKETGRGTGLGLSTVYGIIKQMNGYIFCDSELGKGTTFRIFLPRYEGPQGAEEAAPAKAARPASPARDLSGAGRVLLVEDEDAVRSFAVRALELRGYTVSEAASGEEALERVEENPDGIDLIVSDVVMPNMTGPELMRKARAIRPDIRFIFISGYAEDAFREEMVGDEEDYLFLAKPFALKDLAVKVKDALEA